MNRCLDRSKDKLFGSEDSAGLAAKSSCWDVEWSDSRLECGLQNAISESLVSLGEGLIRRSTLLYRGSPKWRLPDPEETLREVTLIEETGVLSDCCFSRACACKELKEHHNTETRKNTYIML